MKLYDFVFTRERPQRYYRHIAFWSVRVLCMLLFNGSFLIYGEVAPTWKVIIPVLKVTLFFFCVESIFCYTITLFLLTAYLKKGKTGTFIVIFLLLTLVMLAGGMCFIAWNLHLSFNTTDALLGFIFQQILVDLFFGPHITLGYFLAILLMKGYYLKMKQREILAKENTNAELQLLKDRIHPHFLFNTLNNIYSFTLGRFAQAERLVIHLSDTLRYMIRECDGDTVPLEKELKMIRDYIELEKVRYGDRLDIRVSIGGATNDKSIAPLLMIAFVENSFKHGTSQLLRDPWIELSIRADEEVLHFVLANGKPVAGGIPDQPGGIGLVNVKKRLELLYGDGHHLTIDETSDTFTVNLQVPILKSPAYAP